MLDPSWILGHAKTSYTSPSNPISLPLKSTSTSPPSSPPTSFPSFVQSTIPACTLNPFLANGHLQTMYTAVKDAGPPIYYKRRIYTSTHTVYPGHFAVDFVVPPPSPPSTFEADPTLPERTTFFAETEWEKHPSNDTAPMLVCLHGLTGGSHEVYLRQVVAPLTAAGWEACVVNGRGCALSKISTPELFNSRATWDVRQVIAHLQTLFPHRPLYGVGFSLGANILTNYLGEEGDKCVLRAAVACSNPWNLEVCSVALQRSWLGKEVYLKVMGGNMMKLFEAHKEQILKNPKIEEDRVRECKYLYEFDRVIQAPTWGYPTEGAYYRDAQSVDALMAIRIPFLGINAEDDPISHVEAIPYEEFKQNPYAVLCTTNWGGHLSWFQLGGKRWFATAVAAFFTNMHDDVDWEKYALQKSKANANANANGTVETTKKYPIWDPNNRRLILPQS